MSVVINLPITIADADVARLQAATRATFGSELTDEQIVEKLRQEVITTLKGMVRRYEREAAMAQAESDVRAAEVLDPVVDVT